MRSHSKQLGPLRAVAGVAVLANALTATAGADVDNRRGKHPKTLAPERLARNNEDSAAQTFKEKDWNCSDNLINIRTSTLKAIL